MPRQQPQQRRYVFERRHDFFDAGDRDVHARQARHHAPVAFVGHDQRRARFGDDEIGAGDAHVRGQKMPAQHFARFARQLGDDGLARTSVLLLEQVRYLVARLCARPAPRCATAALSQAAGCIRRDRFRPPRTPAASSASLSAHSSLTIDFDLTAFCTPYFAASSHTMRFTSAVVSAQCTTVPRAVALRLEFLEIDIEMLERAVADRRRGIADAAKLSSSATRSARPLTKLPCSFSSAACSSGRQAWPTRALKCMDATCMVAGERLDIAYAARPGGGTHHLRPCGDCALPERHPVTVFMQAHMLSEAC